MAEENSARYRPSDASDRDSGPADQPSDPLAELARLIGRSDPFSELGRESQPAPRREHGLQGLAAAHSSRETPPTHAPEPAPQDNDPGPRYGADPLPHLSAGSTPPHASEPAPYASADHAPQYPDDQPARLDWPGSLDSVRPHAADPFVLPSQHSRVPTADTHEDHTYSDPHQQPATEGEPSDRLAADAPDYPAVPDRAAFLQSLYPQQPEAGSMPPPHDDEFYDDAPPSNRRKGLLTVAAVLALAVIGTAGALGYRTYFAGPTSSAPPPVIRASGEPSKVAPATQPVDQSASKFSYDRHGDRGQNEQVVVREEKPVDNRELGRTSVARTALPGAPNPPSASNASTSNASAASAPAAQSAPNPPSALGEPRRVKTVPIRPDQPDSAAAPPPPSRQQQAAPMQIAPAPPPPTRQAATAPTAPPSPPAAAPPSPPAAANSPAVNARAAAPQRSNQRVAARTAGPGENAPLSLSPDANNLPPPATAAREAPPPRPMAAPPPAPARVAAAPAGNGGGYLVQVSSQKSEADAQSSYRTIQAKFSNVLNGQRHIIKRADLGSRGIYYRAMVGPFGNRDQAVQLCSSLKAAGGDCVVQTN